MPPQASPSQLDRPAPPPGYHDADAPQERQASARPPLPPGYHDVDDTAPKPPASAGVPDPAQQAHDATAAAIPGTQKPAPMPAPKPSGPPLGQISGISGPAKPPSSLNELGQDAYQQQPHNAIDRYLNEAEDLTEEGKRESPVKNFIGQTRKDLRESGMGQTLLTLGAALGGATAPKMPEEPVGQMSDAAPKAPPNAGGQRDVVAPPASTGGTMRPSVPEPGQLKPEQKLLPPGPPEAPAAPEPGQGAPPPPAKRTFTITPPEAKELTPELSSDMTIEAKRLRAQERDLMDKTGRSRNWRVSQGYIDRAQQAGERASDLEQAIKEGRGVDVSSKGKTELRPTYKALDQMSQQRVDDLVDEYRGLDETGPYRKQFEDQHEMGGTLKKGLPIEEKLAQWLQQQGSGDLSGMDTSGVLKNTGSLRPTAPGEPPPHVAKAMEGLDVEYLGSKDGLEHFTDKQTSTSYAIPTDQVTPETLGQKVNAARENYAPGADLNGKIPRRQAAEPGQISQISDTAGGTSIHEGAQAAKNLRQLLDNPGTVLPTPKTPTPNYRTLDMEPISNTVGNTRTDQSPTPGQLSENVETADGDTSFNPAEFEPHGQLPQPEEWRAAGEQAKTGETPTDKRLPMNADQRDRYDWHQATILDLQERMREAVAQGETQAATNLKSMIAEHQRSMDAMRSGDPAELSRNYGQVKFQRAGDTPIGQTPPAEVEGSERAETPSRNTTLVDRMAREIPGNNPLEPDVPLGKQKPAEQRPPARAAEAGMVDESVHSDDRRFIHVNGSRMQEAVGEFTNDNAVAKRVFNLENNQVREALAQSGEDMGSRRVVSAGSKTADPNDFTRQEALDMLLDKGYSPEEIAAMGEKAPRAKPAKPLTFKLREKDGPKG